MFRKKDKRVGDSVVKRYMIVKQRTWHRSVICIESTSFKSDTVEIIGARWRWWLVWKEKGLKLTKTRKDIKKK